MGYKNKTKAEYGREYRFKNKGTLKFWLTKTYGRMKRDNKLKFNKDLSFSKEEFEEWVLVRKELFDKLMDEYIKSNFNKYKNPSIDRIDDYIGYEFYNMQLISWEENNNKGRKSSKNKEQCSEMAKNVWSKRVLQLSQENEIINKYYSTREAGRINGFNNSGIARACREGKIYKGYYWRYEDE